METPPARPRRKRAAAKPPEARPPAGLTLPEFVEPMRAKSVSQLPAGPEWLYELKYDGYRFLGAKAEHAVTLWSRNGNDLTARFPQVAQALADWKIGRALVDGELVVFDREGRPSFQGVQNADEQTEVRAILFDLLVEGGSQLQHQTLAQRRAALQRLVRGAPAGISLSDALAGEPADLLQAVAELGLEGVVAKDLRSTYSPGARNGRWLKVKCVQSQEFVIGGYSPPKGSRSHFGALLVGYFERGVFRYAGRVGTGFDARTLQAIHTALQPLVVSKCPFRDLPPQAEARGCTWVRPELVVQVRFAEWTSDHLLRHASLLGARTDKDAREVGAT